MEECHSTNKLIRDNQKGEKLGIPKNFKSLEKPQLSLFIHTITDDDSLLLKNKVV